jgi:hypothetical protein
LRGAQDPLHRGPLRALAGKVPGRDQRLLAVCGHYARSLAHQLARAERRPWPEALEQATARIGQSISATEAALRGGAGARAVSARPLLDRLQPDGARVDALRHDLAKLDQAVTLRAERAGVAFDRAPQGEEVATADRVSAG